MKSRFTPTLEVLEPRLAAARVFAAPYPQADAYLKKFTLAYDEGLQDRLNILGLEYVLNQQSGNFGYWAHNIRLATHGPSGTTTLGWDSDCTGQVYAGAFGNYGYEMSQFADDKISLWDDVYMGQARQFQLPDVPDADEVTFDADAFGETSSAGGMHFISAWVNNGFNHEWTLKLEFRDRFETWSQVSVSVTVPARALQHWTYYVQQDYYSNTYRLTVYNPENELDLYHSLNFDPTLT